QDRSVYELQNFNAFDRLTDDIRGINGVNDVISLPVIKMILKDTVESKFYLKDVFPDDIGTQQQLDSALRIAEDQRIYMDQIMNDQNGATMMLISVRNDVMNSARRDDLVKSLLEMGDKFEKETGIGLHYAGLPFIRTYVASQVKKEMQIFLYASGLITWLIMFLFLRSFRALLVSMLSIVIVMSWSLGTLTLFDYKITLLSGLVSAVIVIIGISDGIYLLNK